MSQFDGDHDFASQEVQLHGRGHRVPVPTSRIEQHSKFVHIVVSTWVFRGCLHYLDADVARTKQRRAARQEYYSVPPQDDAMPPPSSQPRQVYGIPLPDPLPLPPQEGYWAPSLSPLDPNYQDKVQYGPERGLVTNNPQYLQTTQSLQTQVFNPVAPPSTPLASQHSKSLCK